MSPQNFANVKIECRCGGRSTTWCVRIDRGVPERLRCIAGGGGGGGSSEVRCGKCGHRCFPSVSAFESAVRSAVDRGWDRHIRNGVVVVEC